MMSSASYDVFGAIRSQTGSSPNYWQFTAGGPTPYGANWERIQLQNGEKLDLNNHFLVHRLESPHYSSTGQFAPFGGEFWSGEMAPEEVAVTVVPLGTQGPLLGVVGVGYNLATGQTFTLCGWGGGIRSC